MSSHALGTHLHSLQLCTCRSMQEQGWQGRSYWRKLVVVLEWVVVVVVGVWGLKTDFKSACVSEEAACVRESASRSTGLARSARPSKWSINRSKPSKLKAAQGKPLPPSLQRARWETESGAREGGVPFIFL